MVSSGEWLVTGAEDGSVTLWHWPTGKLEQELEPHYDAVNAMALHCKQEASGGALWQGSEAVGAVQDQTLITAGRDGLVRRCSLATGLVLMHYQGHLDEVQAVATTNSAIFSCDSSGETRQWDLGSGVVQRVIQTAPACALCVAWGYVFIATQAGHVRREWAWDVPWNREAHCRFPVAFRRHVFGIVVSLSLSGLKRWADLQDELFGRLEEVEAGGALPGG